MKTTRTAAAAAAALYFGGHALFAPAPNLSIPDDSLNWQSLAGESQFAPVQAEATAGSVQQASMQFDERESKVTNPFAASGISVAKTLPDERPVPDEKPVQETPQRVVNRFAAQPAESRFIPPVGVKSLPPAGGDEAAADSARVAADSARITNPYLTGVAGAFARNLPLGQPESTRVPNMHFGKSVASLPPVDAPPEPFSQPMKDDGAFQVPAKPVQAMAARTPQAPAIDSPFVPDLTATPARELVPPQVAESVAFSIPKGETSPGPELMTGNTPSSPSIASPVVEERAMEHVNYGKSLARRGASFAAREEFMQALRLIADSHDMNSQSRKYTSHLAAGLRALVESDDFVTVNVEQQLTMDLAPLVSTHTSKVPAVNGGQDMAPIQAMQVYYQFAAEQLAIAVGESPVAGEALHAMGKLLMTTARYDAAGKPIDRAKAMVMFQAAMSANPADCRSANELGVLMASNGQWEKARELFQTSLRARRTPEAWMNLSRAHEKLGETGLAQLAASEYRLMPGNAEVVAGHSMAWVDEKQFEAGGATPEDFDDADGMRTARSDAPAPSSASGEPANPTGKGLLGSRKKWF